MMTSSVACIFSSCNFSRFREMLDLTLAVSAFNKVSVFFIGSAVPLLYGEVDPVKLGERNFIKTLKMLELYEVSSIYICNDDVTPTCSNAPILNAEIISMSEIVAKIDKCSHKLTI